MDTKYIIIWKNGNENVSFVTDLDELQRLKTMCRDEQYDYKVFYQIHETRWENS